MSRNAQFGMGDNKLDQRFYPGVYQAVAGNNYTVYAYLKNLFWGEFRILGKRFGKFVYAGHMIQYKANTQNYWKECQKSKEFAVMCRLMVFKKGNYMTDFVCVKTGGNLMLRECVWRNRMTKPLKLPL